MKKKFAVFVSVVVLAVAVAAATAIVNRKPTIPLFRKLRYQYRLLAKQLYSLNF